MSAKRNQAQAIGSPSSSTGNVEGNSMNNDDHVDKKFKQVHGDGDEDDDDDDDDDAPKSNKRAGRRKIKIEYIEDKSRRHITFSKRKSGIMKKAYELSTLTGTQVLLLVVSETGLVYTFTTPKLQPLVTKAEGKNLIQACLHAPDKEPTPESNNAAEADTPEAMPVPDYEDRSGTSPQQPSTQASPQQQPMQPYPGQPQAGYGSSSAMSVPTYPSPYSHIPFPAQYNMNMHYQNPPPNGPPTATTNYGGNQYWSGPPPPHQAQQQQRGQQKEDAKPVIDGK
ncbi:transcription factor of the MADS box [Gamsiella multidivaricata]|nr:transcription factor of the MADS box [Gamsiella multidivaricata]